MPKGFVHGPADREPEDPDDPDPTWSTDPERDVGRPLPSSGLEILRGSGAREILARLIEGDPLELRPRCEEAMREGGWLVDAQRLFLRSAARTARGAIGYAGVPPIGPWLATNIATSIADLVTEDREAERAGMPPPEPYEARLTLLAEAFGIEPAAARGACVRFHRLPVEIRATFYSVVVEQVPIERCAKDRVRSLEEIELCLTRALEAFGGV